MNLASRMRPQTLEDFFGQKHLVGEGQILRRIIDSGQLSSMIFWGPPGSGKTTLAQIVASKVSGELFALSAVSTGKEDLNKVITTAKDLAKENKKTILFLDEIHRWNKAQQDALLPHVESGLITLIGATTENPSFEVISALLSRSRIFVLKALDVSDLKEIVNRALKDEVVGLGKHKKTINEEALNALIRLSGGDARIMLNALEICVLNFPAKEIDISIIENVFQTKSAGIYDKKADEHYNTISAFIKSVRGSDPDASLYYLARMIENGEDPKFIARRLIILASEDVGLADRGALIQANAAFEAVQKIGFPEAGLTLAHVTLYLATAKKSRAVANALMKAKQAVYDIPNAPIPLHLRNAPTKLMKDLGYASDYQWSEKYVGPEKGKGFLPEVLKDRKFFEP